MTPTNKARCWHPCRAEDAQEAHNLLAGDVVGGIADHCNTRKQAAKSCQEACLKLYLCVMLRRAPVNTCVPSCLEQHAFDLLSPYPVEIDNRTSIDEQYCLLRDTISHVKCFCLRQEETLITHFMLDNMLSGPARLQL